MSDFLEGLIGAGTTGTLGPGASGPFIQNNGIALGEFEGINLLGGLVGVVGPSNTVNVNSLNDFMQAGLGAAGQYIPSGASVAGMIQYNQAQYALGSIGHTTVGTAAGMFLLNKSGYYAVDSSVNFTGLPSGVVVQTMQFLNATGAYGGGTPIAPSVSYFQLLSPAGSQHIAGGVDSSYITYIPSGSSIETFVAYISGGGGAGMALSPTGTFLSLQLIG
jgi:hypothetical protein